MMQSILVVDDNEEFRSLVRQSLERAGYKTFSAGTGRSAQHMLGIEKVDLVLSDIQMPELNGIELAHHIRRTSGIPVVLMSGLAELGSDPRDIGAADFLGKPFKRDDLLAVLRRCLGSRQPALEREPDEDGRFCKLPVADFISGSSIQHDIFLRISSSKYLKLARRGDPVPTDRLKIYQERGLRYLYLDRADFRKYVGFNLAMTKAAGAWKGIDPRKKLGFLRHTGEVLLEDFRQNGVDEEGFSNAKAFVQASIESVADDPDALSLMMLLNSHGDFLYAHSLGVALYGVLIAKAMKWTSPQTLFKVSMGGLFHDIGTKEIERGLLEKTRAQLSAAEVKIFESHVQRGVDLLGKVGSFSSDLLQVVLHHHEDCQGMGYPRGLRKEAIHPIARLVAVADGFCSLVLKSPGHEPLEPRQAIERMLTVHGARLDLGCMAALATLFGVAPPVKARRKRET